MKKFLLLIILNLIIYSQDNEFIRGVDLSSVKHIEDLGGTYFREGTPTDPLEIFRQNGVGWVRLRLWHTPADGYSGLTSVIAYAEKVKQFGLKFLLDIHYSDTWADPAHQSKPAAWANLNFNTLADSVYQYTYDVIRQLDSLGIAPEMVQIGNEIVGGMLWNEGIVGGAYENSTQWTQFTTLLKRGISAVHDAAPDKNIRIMIHIDRGGDNNSCRWYYGKLNDYNVPFDIIGLSYYPWWHGTLTNLRNNLNDLATRFNKEIVIAEFGYPWTLQWYDNTNNIVGNSGQLHSGYPASVEGQKAFTTDLIDIVKKIPNTLGLGVFYWEPAYIAVSPYGSPWENVAMFDFQGNALSSIEAFKEVIIDTSNAVNVTFRLNSATNTDTLHTSAFIQIRGEAVTGSVILPNEKTLTWDDESGVKLENIGGDYWQATVRCIPGTELHYKYWSGHALNKPTNLRLGWEGAISPYDNSSGNYRKFIAGNKDTTLQIEYYNSSAETKTQYWTPFSSNPDSVGVLFRINMTTAINSGRFNADINGPISVRGESISSENVLDWDISKVILNRETNSVNNGSFWSGIAFFPSSDIGNEITFKYFIENDSENGWENNISNRTFILPAKDTTIYWDFFNSKANISALEDEKVIDNSFVILKNYPNPFNPSTTIEYTIPQGSKIKLSVYNLLGQEIKSLKSEYAQPGIYRVKWNGENDFGAFQSSGIYIVKLQTDYTIKATKVLLLK